MFLARIDGTLTSTIKHETLEGCRLLIGQRLDADDSTIGDPLVLIDTLGAAHGATVIVTTDNETLRTRVGKTTPARLVVCGLVDEKVEPGSQQFGAPQWGRLAVGTGPSIPPAVAPAEAQRKLGRSKKATPLREPGRNRLEVVSTKNATSHAESTDRKSL